MPCMCVHSTTRDGIVSLLYLCATALAASPLEQCSSTLQQRLPARGDCNVVMVYAQGAGRAARVRRVPGPHTRASGCTSPPFVWPVLLTPLPPLQPCCITIVSAPDPETAPMGPAIGDPRTSTRSLRLHPTLFYLCGWCACFKQLLLRATRQVGALGGDALGPSLVPSHCGFRKKVSKL